MASYPSLREVCAGYYTKGFMTYRLGLANTRSWTVHAEFPKCLVDLQLYIAAAVSISGLLKQNNFSFLLFSAYTSLKPVTAAMAPPLKWATWALAVSHSRGHPGPEQEAAEPVKWEDLMVAASRFPRFFGSPARVPRTDPPKVAALSYKNFPGVQLSPFGKIEPMHCSSDSGNFACAVDCKCANPAEKSLPAYVTLQERNSSLSHHIDGLDFISDYWLTTDHTGHKLLRHFFTQTLDGKVPIDNTQVILALVSQ